MYEVKRLVIVTIEYISTKYFYRLKTNGCCFKMTLYTYDKGEPNEKKSCNESRV